jgi:hypothetical protein
MIYVKNINDEKIVRKWRYRLQLQLFRQKKIIIALFLKETTYFFTENWRQSMETRQFHFSKKK